MNAESLPLWLNDCQQHLDSMSQYHVFLLNMQALAHREYGFSFYRWTAHLFAWGTDTLQALPVIANVLCSDAHKGFSGAAACPPAMALTFPFIVHFTRDSWQPGNGNTFLATNGATESKTKRFFFRHSQLSLLLKPSNSSWHPLRNGRKESKHPIFFGFQHFSEVYWSQKI